MERVVRGRSFTLSQTFYSDGTPIAPTGSPTVAIVRADGTIVTTSAISGTGTGPYTVTVTAANNTLLDTLTVTWTATIGGQPNTYVDTVEVAGDFLFSVAEARAAIGDPAYDAAKIADARTYAETELEGAIGFALVPRYTYTSLQADRGMPLRLKPYTTVIRSATSNGIALTSGDLTGLTYSAGFVTGYRWSGTVVVGYEHGLQTAPPGAKRAALALALDYLDSGASSSIDPRASSIVTVDGTINLRAGGGQFLAAGVNEWIDANRLPAIA